MEEREIEMEKKDEVKGKGKSEERCLGASQWHTAGEWARGSDGGQDEVSIAGGLSVFSCSSVFHLLTQL